MLMTPAVTRNGRVVCPNCFSEYLHHSPAKRNDDEEITIGFMCEHCDVKHELHIEQLEGRTIMVWSVVE